MLVVLLPLLAACVPEPSPAPADRVPADDPTVDALGAWSREPGAYGLGSPDELAQRVRLRHGLLGRLRAMTALAGGDPAGCAVAYRAARSALGDAHADAPTQALRQALMTGAAVCDTLSAGPETAAEDDAAAVSVWVRWARVAARGDRDAGARLADTLEATTHTASPGPAGSEAAWHAWGAALDPILPSETLAAWSGAEPGLRDAAVAEAARAGAATGTFDLRAPSRRLGTETAPFDASGLGAIPGADTLADLAHLPFARPLRRLARMDASDPSHRAYLDVQATHLRTLGAPDVPVDVEALASRYDRMGHTSRWYNRAALRQAAARNLAGRGAWRQAARILEAEATLTGPAWRVVARDSDVRALQAALLLRAGDPARAADLISEAEGALARFEGAVGGR